MKKLLLVLAVAAFATACNNESETKTESTADTTVVTAPDTTVVKPSTDTTVVVTDTTKKM